MANGSNWSVNMSRKSHKDVEFHVDMDNGAKVFKRFDAAVTHATLLAMQGKPVNVDTCVWSRAGAKWLAGDYGVEQYNEDPEASVFDRITITANHVGRIA